MRFNEYARQTNPLPHSFIPKKEVALPFPYCLKPGDECVYLHAEVTYYKFFLIKIIAGSFIGRLEHQGGEVINSAFRASPSNLRAN